ncbi:TolC family protein [Dyella sp. KRB-257]|uniref:TolC family protein n=1 Tax=Dyella sp. KRB-257 TaxID=3400915 RepID=UPI003C11AEA7
MPAPKRGSAPAADTRGGSRAPAIATRTALRALLVLGLAGCAAVPTAPAPDLQRQAQALDARRLDDPGLAAAEARLQLPSATDAAWTPDRITVAAWYFDPALAQARAGARRAEADAALASQRSNPTLQLSPEKIFSGGGVGSPWTIGAALLIPLLHPGESAARRDIAAADTEQARDQAALALWQSRTRALGALREVLLARRAQALAQHVATAAAGYRDRVRRRVAAGASGRDAELAAELDAQRAAADLANRTAQRGAAEHALAGAIGVPWSALRTVPLAWPQLQAPPAPDALPASALAQDAAWNRLDLAALLAHYRASAARLREAAGTRYPATSVAPGYIYDRGRRKFAFGIDVELPLFHGAGARIRAAAAARDEAAAAVQARQARILNELDAARADYAERYAAWQRMLDVAAAARKSAARARTQRRAGQIDRGRETVAEVAAAHAELAAVDALGAALNSLGRLEDVLQRPLWPASTLAPPAATDPPPSSSLTETAHAH